MTLRYSQSLLRSWLCTLLATATLAVAHAQTVWTGAQDANYFTADNWSNGLPADGNNAIIPGGSTVFVNGNLVADYTIESFGTVTLGGTLTVEELFSNSGTLLTQNNRVNVVDSVANFGAIDIAAGGSLFVTPTGGMRSNGTITSDGWIGVTGLFSNEGTVTIEAERNIAVYNGGVYNNAGVLELFGVYNNRHNGTYNAPSGGTIRVKVGGKLNNYALSTINNAGILRVEAGGIFNQRSTLNNNPGRIFVEGQLRTYDSSVTVTNFLTVEAGGLLNVDRGDSFEVVFSLVNNGVTRINLPVTVNGIFDNKAGAELTITSVAELDFVAGTNLLNAGSLTNLGGIRSVGTIRNAGVFVNRGQVVQNNGGSIVNDSLFRNEALIESVNRIVNNATFLNAGRLTNGSGGQIENNARFENLVDAHIQNLFEIFNRGTLTNRGYFENGVSLFNESLFNNYGFLDNVGDIFNTPSGTIRNYASGVIDNSGSGITTNEGLIVNDGEINNFNCGIFVNNNRIVNNQWISNEGIFYNDGTITGKPIMGGGVVTTEGGTSPLICRPFKQKLDQNGRTRVSGTRLAAVRFDSCRALEYLIDGKEFRDFTCADLGIHQVTLTLRDRRGNEVSCKTTLTITDEFAPIVDQCPADITLANVERVPAAATWRVPRFTDNCDADVTVTSNKKPGDLFPEGSTVVTYTATDDAGNRTICEFTVVVTLKKGCPAKDPMGLVAYYNLTRESDRYVFDRAGYGDPLHLEIKDRSTITYDADCGLTNTAHSIVKSLDNASNVGHALMMTNALTVEAWVRADKLQAGPERVVTYSENTGARNFTLGQENDRWVFRLKTTQTDGNGMPNREAPSGSVKVGRLQHVVFTRAANGDERFYVDGAQVYAGNRGGNFSNWGSHCHLALFNEMTLDRSFKGAIKKVAIYDRALSLAEVRTSRAAGACCDGDDSPLGQVCQGPRGEVTHERYNGIGGSDLPWLYKASKYPKSPDVTRKLTRLEIPANVGDNYGTRTRGWIYPAKTGDYQFAVAGDDHTRLLLSRAADNAGYAYTVAAVYGWTNPGDLHKYSSQKSGVFHLEAGKGYYFELHQKEGSGGDHAQVYWKVPGASNFALIGAAHIGDIKQCATTGTPTGPECVAQRGGLLREVWNGVHSSDIWALMQDSRYPHNPDSRGLINEFAGPTDVGDNYGTRVRGYIHADVTGDYTFTVTGDNQTKLMLSTDATADKAVAIAELNGWTGVTEFAKYSTQRSRAIRLVAGQRYYVELIHQEGSGGDHFHVYWQTPGNSTRHLIPGSNLSPYVDCEGGARPETCNKTALLVVGNTTLNNGDAAVLARLRQLGYDVMVKDAAWATPALAAGKGLVLISSTVNSTDIGTKFRDVATPVLTWESWLYDDMRMTAGSANQDYGNDHGTSLNVVGGTDVLAAGQQGTQVVTSRAQSIRWGKVMGSEARVIAYAPADPWIAAIFAYDKGAQMAGGLRAPGIRIGFYLDDESAANWTTYGRSLFDAAVRYASNCSGAANQLSIDTDVLTLAADRRREAVELKWTNNTAYKNVAFAIERSADGVSFEQIAEVGNVDEGDAPRSYYYADEAPLEGEGFYRVIARFNDGTDRESEVRSVEFARLGDVAIYPNPATEAFAVSLEGFESKMVTLTVVDQLGRKLLTRELDGSQGSVTVDATEFPSGAYAVSLRSGGFVATSIVVVSRD